MRRFPVTAFVLVLAVVALAGAWVLFAKSEHDRYVAVQRVATSRSEFRIGYTVDHTDGRIAREQWQFRNIDGKSTASYAVTDRSGTTARFDEPIVGYDVTFLFDKLVADGIWDLQSRPLRGKNDALHTVAISQVADTQSGRHTFVFSDPDYIATTAGREYHIHLDPHKPVPDILSLQSTSTADPRYKAIVEDFESFGSPQFRRTVAAAREKLLAAGHAKG